MIESFFNIQLMNYLRDMTYDSTIQKFVSHKDAI